MPTMLALLVCAACAAAFAYVAVRHPVAAIAIVLGGMGRGLRHPRPARSLAGGSTTRVSCSTSSPRCCSRCRRSRADPESVGPRAPARLRPRRAAHDPHRPWRGRVRSPDRVQQCADLALFRRCARLCRHPARVPERTVLALADRDRGGVGCDRGAVLLHRRRQVRLGADRARRGAGQLEADHGGRGADGVAGGDPASRPALAFARGGADPGRCASSDPAAAAAADGVGRRAIVLAIAGAWWLVDHPERRRVAIGGIVAAAAALAIFVGGAALAGGAFWDSIKEPGTEQSTFIWRTEGWSALIRPTTIPPRCDRQPVRARLRAGARNRVDGYPGPQPVRRCVRAFRWAGTLLAACLWVLLFVRWRRVGAGSAIGGRPFLLILVTQVTVSLTYALDVSAGDRGWRAGVRASASPPRSGAPATRGVSRRNDPGGPHVRVVAILASHNRRERIERCLERISPC